MLLISLICNTAARGQGLLPGASEVRPTAWLRGCTCSMTRKKAMSSGQDRANQHWLHLHWYAQLGQRMSATLCCRGSLQPLWACAWSPASWSCQCLPSLLCRRSTIEPPGSPADGGRAAQPHSPSPVLEAEVPAVLRASTQPDQQRPGSYEARSAVGAAPQLTAAEVLEEGSVETDRSVHNWRWPECWLAACTLK